MMTQLINDSSYVLVSRSSRTQPQHKFALSYSFLPHDFAMHHGTKFKRIPSLVELDYITPQHPDSHYVGWLQVTRWSLAPTVERLNPNGLGVTNDRTYGPSIQFLARRTLGSLSQNLTYDSCHKNQYCHCQQSLRIFIQYQGRNEENRYNVGSQQLHELEFFCEITKILTIHNEIQYCDLHHAKTSFLLKIDFDILASYDIISQ